MFARCPNTYNLICGTYPTSKPTSLLGLDTDEGPSLLKLTKRFLDMTPGLSGLFAAPAFGRRAAHLDYQRSNAWLPFPFHFLNNNGP